MNQKQRDFLIDQVNKTRKARIEELKALEPKEPSLSAFLHQAVMDGSAILKSQEELMKAFKTKARTAAEKGDKFLETSYRYRSSEDEGATLTIDPLAIFEMPTEFSELKRKYLADKLIYIGALNAVNAKVDGIITRIQLATDKTLDTIIEQIDGMGAMSFTDFTPESLSLATLAPNLRLK